MFNRIELICLQGRQKRYYPFREPAAKDINLFIDSREQLKQGQKVTVMLDSQEQVELLDFRWELSPGLSSEGKMMVNGFQSWSRSGEMAPWKRLTPLGILSRPMLAPFGDYRLHRYSRRSGRFHSWTVTYFQLPDETVLLIGSLDESRGYTLFEYDYNRDRLGIRKECRGGSVSDNYPLLSLYMGIGELDKVMNEYCSQLKLPRRASQRATAWTSWHNYYTAISGTTARENLNTLASHRLPLDYFLVEDGWQSGLGDWLESNEKFSTGMKALAAEIHAAGYRAGLWLAPFVCNRESGVFQQNPQWLLRNSRRKPVRAGYNSRWHGWFYALDFYAPGFKEYLRQVLETVQEKWDYDLLKLDYLYAAALLPRQGKTRGQIMTEVMDFIQQHTRNSKVLGGGVPLGPAMGQVDYCRTGSDTAPSWETLLKTVNYRERASTENSLQSAIGRHFLDRRGFRNDPDAFMLRNGESGNNLNHLDPQQRYTLFFLKNLLGGFVSFSDDLAGYTGEQLQLLQRAFPNLETSVIRLDNDNELFQIEFTVNKRIYLALANLTGARRSVALKEGLYFHPDLFVLGSGSTVRLEPFETICLHSVERREDRAYLLGSTGHIFPGAQVDKLIVRARSVTLQLHEHASPESKVFLAVPRGVINLPVNKVNYPVTLKNRVHYVTVPFSGMA